MLVYFMKELNIGTKCGNPTLVSKLFIRSVFFYYYYYRLKSSPVRQFLATLLLALFVIFYWLSQVGPVKHIPLPMARTTYGHIIFTNKTGIGEILEERGTNTVPSAIREDHAEMPSSFSEELRKLLPSVSANQSNFKVYFLYLKLVQV